MRLGRPSSSAGPSRSAGASPMVSRAMRVSGGGGSRRDRCAGRTSAAATSTATANAAFQTSSPREAAAAANAASAVATVSILIREFIFGQTSRVCAQGGWPGKSHLRISFYLAWRCTELDLRGHNSGHNPLFQAHFAKMPISRKSVSGPSLSATIMPPFSRRRLGRRVALVREYFSCLIYCLFYCPFFNLTRGYRIDSIDCIDRI